MKKEENNIYSKPMYKCAICGEVFEDIESRTKCEMTCVEKVKEEKKAIDKAKKEAEKKERQQEVSAALDNAYALIGKYIEDYGSFTYNGKYKGLDMLNMDFFPSKLWHHFWF